MKTSKVKRVISGAVILACLALIGDQAYLKLKGKHIIGKLNKPKTEIEEVTTIEEEHVDVPKEEIQEIPPVTEEYEEDYDDDYFEFYTEDDYIDDDSYLERARLIYNNLAIIGGVSDLQRVYSVEEIADVLRILNAEYVNTGAHVAKSNISYVESFYTSINNSEPFIERSIAVQTPSESHSAKFPTVQFGLSMYNMLVGDNSLGDVAPLIKYFDDLHTLGLTCETREDAEKYCRQFFVNLRYLTSGVGINLNGRHYTMESIVNGENSIISMSLLELYIYDLAPLVNSPFTFVDTNGIERIVDLDNLLTDFRSGGRYYEAWSEAVNTQTSTLRR